ncbi:hypothetical protein D9M72_620900 [compost metagenome]
MRKDSFQNFATFVVKQRCGLLIKYKRALCEDKLRTISKLHQCLRTIFKARHCCKQLRATLVVERGFQFFAAFDFRQYGDQSIE